MMPRKQMCKIGSKMRRPGGEVGTQGNKVLLRLRVVFPPEVRVVLVLFLWRAYVKCSVFRSDEVVCHPRAAHVWYIGFYEHQAAWGTDIERGVPGASEFTHFNAHRGNEIPFSLGAREGGAVANHKWL